jgi:RimJ/RimL family protein N-acetyltransferase
MSDALKLRRVTRADADLLRRWRNDPSARRQFFDSARVARAAHGRWLDERLRDRRSLLLIAEAGGEAVGQVRFERAGASGAEISVSVDRAHRGRGLGVRVIRLGVARARRVWRLRSVLARVQAANAASAIAFLKAGFEFRAVERVRGRRIYRLEWSR